MRLYFVITTNLPVPWINTAIFRSPNGDEVVIDRHTTEYTTEEIKGGLYRIEMMWRECYVWDGENENILSDDDTSVYELQLVELELEDDAADEIDDYSADVESYSWG
jgi:hypothetical protein